MIIDLQDAEKITTLSDNWFQWLLYHLPFCFHCFLTSNEICKFLENSRKQAYKHDIERANKNLAELNKNNCHAPFTKLTNQFNYKYCLNISVVVVVIITIKKLGFVEKLLLCYVLITGVADFFSKETKTKELLQADEDRVSSGPGPSIASSSPGPSNACSSPGRSSVSLSPGPSSASSSPGPSSASSSPGPSTAHPGVSTEELGIEPLDED